MNGRFSDRKKKTTKNSSAGWVTSDLSDKTHIFECSFFVRSEIEHIENKMSSNFFETYRFPLLRGMNILTDCKFGCIEISIATFSFEGLSIFSKHLLITI